MRTTIDLPDHLLVDAKKLAAERHVPLTRLLEESLRAYLAEERTRPRGKPEPLLGDTKCMASVITALEVRSLPEKLSRQAETAACELSPASR